MADPAFPAMLAEADDAPPLLLTLGKIELLAGRAVAMVGARNASANGRLLAETMARELGEQGWVVVSGLARGIDSAAHRGPWPAAPSPCWPGASTAPTRRRASPSTTPSPSAGWW
jgi:DNA processing protein